MIDFDLPEDNDLLDMELEENLGADNEYTGKPGNFDESTDDLETDDDFGGSIVDEAIEDKGSKRLMDTNSRLQASQNFLHNMRQIKFGEAGECWWCGGTGVEYWPSGAAMPCSHCGGTAIGPR